MLALPSILNFHPSRRLLLRCGVAMVLLGAGRLCLHAHAQATRAADSGSAQDENQAIIDGFTILNDGWLALARPGIAQSVNLDAGQIQQIEKLIKAPVAADRNLQQVMQKNKAEIYRLENQNDDKDGQRQIGNLLRVPRERCTEARAKASAQIEALLRNEQKAAFNKLRRSPVERTKRLSTQKRSLPQLLLDPPAKGGMVVAFAFSPDGNTLAGATDIVRIGIGKGGFRVGEGRELVVWDANSGELRLTLDTGGESLFDSLTFSRDGNRLAGADAYTGTVKIWDLPSGKLTRTIAPVAVIYRSRPECPCLYLTPDGKTLIAAVSKEAAARNPGESTGGDLRAWNVETGQEKWSVPDAHVRCASLSADGRSLLAFQSKMDDAIDANEADTSVRIADRKLAIFDVETGKLGVTRAMPGEFPASVSFVSDGKQVAEKRRLVALLDAQSLTLWDLDSGRLERVITDGTPRLTTGSRFSEDGQRLVGLFSTSAISMLDVKSGKSAQEPFSYLEYGVAFSTDLKRLACMVGVPGALVYEPVVFDLTKSDEWLHHTSTPPHTAHSDRIKPRVPDATLRGHTAVVSSVAYSPDGALLASSGDTIRLWDARTKSFKRSLSGNMGGVLAFSNDSKLLASGSFFTSVQLWNPLTGELQGTLEDSGPVNFVAFATDGKSLVTGSHNKSPRVWNVPERKFIPRLDRLAAAVSAVAVSADGNLIATSEQDNSIKLWNAADGQHIRTLKGSAAHLAFTSDGGLLAGAGGMDGTVSIWNVTTGEPLRTFPSQGTGVHAVAISPNGKFVASLSGDGMIHGGGMIRLWHIPSGQLRAMYWGGGGLCLTFSPDGKSLASGGVNGRVCIWNLTADESNNKSVEDDVAGPEASKDGPPMTARVVRRQPWLDGEQGIPAHIWGMCFSPDGRAFIGFGDAGPRGGVRLWDVETGNQLQEFLNGKDVWYTNAMFLPDGKQILSLYSNDKNLYLWDVSTGKIVREFTGHTDQGIVAGISADGRHVVSSGKDETLRLWDMGTAREIWKQDVAGQQLSRLVFSPDGKLILTAGAEGFLETRNAVTGKVLGKLDGQVAPSSGTFSPDSKQVLSWGEGGLVRLCNSRTGKTVRSFAGAPEQVWHAWFHGGGRQVVAWGNDKVFQIWDTASGKKLRQFTVGNFTFPGMGEAVFTPDGQRLLVSDSEGDVRLFDFASGMERHRFEKDKLPKARGFAFSPDGRHVAAGSFREGVYLLQVPDPEKTIDRAAGGSSNESRGKAKKKDASGPAASRATPAGHEKQAQPPRTGAEDRTTQAQSGNGIRSGDVNDGPKPDMQSLLNQFMLTVEEDGVLALAQPELASELSLDDERSGQIQKVVEPWLTARVRRRQLSSQLNAALRIDDDKERAKKTGLLRLAAASHETQIPSIRAQAVAGITALLNPDQRIEFLALARDSSHFESSFIPLEFACGKLALSPDGKTMAVPGPSKVILHQLPDGKNVGDLLTGLEAGNAKFTCPLAFSPDGKSLAAAGPHSRDRWGITVWDIDTRSIIRQFALGELKSNFNPAETPNSPMQISRNLEMIATNGRQAGQSGPVTIWDGLTGANVATLALEEGRTVNCLAFSPDGKTLATGHPDGRIKVWDTDCGKCRLTADDGSRDESVSSVSFLHDGKAVAAAINYSSINPLVKRMPLDVKNGVRRMAFEGQDIVPAKFIFSGNGKSLVGWGYGSASSPPEKDRVNGRFLGVWEVSSGRLRYAHQLRSPGDSASGIVLMGTSADGRIVLVAYQGVPEKPGIHQFSLSGDDDMGHADEQRNSDRLAGTGANGTSSRSGTITIRRVREAEAQGGLQESPDKDVGIRVTGPTARLYDVANQKAFGAPLTHPPTREKRPERRVSICWAFSPDGNYVATGGGYRMTDGTTGEVRVWDAVTGKLVTETDRDSGRVTSVRFSKDSQTVLFTAEPIKPSSK